MVAIEVAELRRPGRNEYDLTSQKIVKQVSQGNGRVWQCSKCGESLEDAFDICWKCGTNRDGSMSEDFAVTEPLDALAQTPDDCDAKDDYQSPKLPTYSYVAIPFLLVWSIVNFVWFIANNLASLESFDQFEVSSPFTVSDILFHLCFTLLVGIPILIAEVKVFRHMFKDPQSTPWDLARETLEILILPDEVRRSHPVFTKLYYGSFVIALSLALIGSSIILYRRAFPS
jgi:hypothetical protein